LIDDKENAMSCRNVKRMRQTSNMTNDFRMQLSEFVDNERSVATEGVL